jgi:hypothetical protein
MNILFPRRSNVCARIISPSTVVKIVALPLSIVLNSLSVVVPKLRGLIVMSITSLLIAAPGAYAGKPDSDAGIPVLGTVIESPDHMYPWEMQRVNATEWAEDGAATRAFNHLQDDLGRPHIDDVWYDFDSDYFHWRGPATGNRMAMTRVKFEREILFPYFAMVKEQIDAGKITGPGSPGLRVGPDGLNNR